MPQDKVEKAVASGDLDGLVRSLHDVAAAFDQARSLGLPVSLPEPLYLACLDIVARHGGPANPDNRPARARPAPGSRTDAQRTSRESNHRAAAAGAPVSGGSSARDSSGAGGAVPMQDVPLRRLVWQVIDPGEEFTVGQVRERLAAIGAEWPNFKVSNALGYWVARNRLTRQRKGVYSYPLSGGTVDKLDHVEVRQESPAGHQARVEVTARGEDRTGGAPQVREKKAM